MMINMILDQQKENMISDETIHAMAEMFKVMGDPTRLRILSLLAEKELCVGELADHLAVSQSAVSHQLRILRALNIVRFQKMGREVFYSLADDHVRDILSRTIEHILCD
ncbi:MAG: ArsR/SmtB family transcription factor [Brevefilum sp.]|jgi:DNA-binding transcriptional ArsR family regulator